MNSFGLFTFGVISTLPMGPAGLNVAASALRKQSFPVSAFLGFLSAEAVYLFLALFLKDMMVSDLQAWKLVTYAIAGLFVMFFGINLIHKNKKDRIMPKPSGFRKSFLITASNPGILLLHLTVLLQVEAFGLLKQVQLVSSFLMGGLITIIAIVITLLYNKDFFAKHALNIEQKCGYLLILMSFVLFKKSFDTLFLL